MIRGTVTDQTALVEAEGALSDALLCDHELSTIGEQKDAIRITAATIATAAATATVPATEELVVQASERQDGWYMRIPNQCTHT